ncbi:unnamed protein product, partial [Porites lobata]
DDDNDQPPVPIWSAYNSLVNEALPVTRVGAPPLLAHPAHEWSTLLTVLMRAQNISVRVVGPGRKTVISLDLGLYLPAKRLQMARCELKNILLRPGELHVVMAMLRTIGSYIDSSGIDMCWIESELYGPSTIKQIIDGKHVKRGKRAHMITLQALFSLYLEAFLEGSPDVRRTLEELSTKVGDACKEGTKENIQTAHHSSTNAIQSSEVVKKMSDFDAANATNPLFTVFRRYMRMVMEMFAFIQAVRNTIIELKEDRNLFARLAMVCKSRPEIDIQEAVGLYEFTVVPRSLFARDGTMLHCSCKSALMHILEKAGGPSTNTQEITAGFKVAIVDGMAEVQSLDKPEWIKNCRDLAEHFTNRLLVKYDVPSSLKSATRVKRQGGHVPIYYRITDSTHIAKLPMKKLLAHSKTKGELTTFLAKNVKDNANGRQVVVAWGTECEVTHRDVRHLRSTQEEADTKIILHALDASVQGATQLSIYSPDTDVLVLALRRYPDLCSHSCFVTGTGSSRRPDDGTRSGVEQLVCRMSKPKTDIKTVKALRWSLFKKNQAESERLPPTQGALHQAILRAHYQLLVWNNDHVANPVLPSPEGYGWQDEDGKWVPVMTNLPPAPEAIIQLVRCKCAKSRCSNNRCQCQKAGIVCTDLCL